METFLVVIYSVLGVYYFSGILTYVFIYTKNTDKNRVYLNATRLMFNRNMETDLDSIIEDGSESPEGVETLDPDISYAGY
jgi:hypothetical protein|tara:strand:+ start:669 stop:908 length:240 start_codon:yes stop_codon:yes gene_type:complete